jgi:hypothetical protein
LEDPRFATTHHRRRYIRSVAEFAKHFGKSPKLPGAEKIREYQLYLVKEKGVSLPSYLQALRMAAS